MPFCAGHFPAHVIRDELTLPKVAKTSVLGARPINQAGILLPDLR
jgi:hypothetical protein